MIHMSQAILLSNTHTYTHIHTHTHIQHSHTQWLLVSYVLVGIALVSGVVVILFERVKRRRGACVDLYIYTYAHKHTDDDIALSGLCFWLSHLKSPKQNIFMKKITNLL